MSWETSELNSLEVNKYLMKGFDCPPAESLVKIIYLKSYDNSERGSEEYASFENNLISSIPHYNREIIGNLDEFFFKLGLWVGSGGQVSLFTNRKLALKEIASEYRNESGNEESKSDHQKYNVHYLIGHIDTYPISSFKKFKIKTILEKDEEYLALDFPDLGKLREHSNLDQYITEINQKLYKQLSKLDQMDWIKFTKTWENLITHHMNSLRIKLDSE